MSLKKERNVRLWQPFFDFLVEAFM